MKLYKLIMDIKKRPGMFVKEERIEYIYYLLSGYCAAQKEIDDIDHKFMSWFTKWLQIWIEENIDSDHICKSFFWYDEIKSIAENEEECDVFYRLVDLFFDDYNNKRGYFSEN